MLPDPLPFKLPPRRYDMPSPDHAASVPKPAGASTTGRELDAMAREYGNRFLLEPAPDNQLPKQGMLAVDAMRLIGEELVLDGIPMRNLATFVTTWMEPEAQRIIAENLHRNFIDHAEYPQTAEIEQRCIRMLAHLFNAPGKTTGARTQGSSEAIMLGALSLKWKWRAHREKAGQDTTRPNLVFGGDVHVVWPFLYPHSEWDFRLEQVRSINASGHKFGLVYPGIGWLVFRESSDLPDDLVFTENYLGKTDATFTLNFSTGSAMVLAQYYNFVRFGHDGYRYIMETMQANARALAERIAGIGEFDVIGSEDDEQLPLVAFQLAGEHNYDEFDVASQLAAERGWMVPAYTLPPDADHIKIMRALVKLTLGHTLASTLADDIAAACDALRPRGGLHEDERKRVKTGTGY